MTVSAKCSFILSRASSCISLQSFTHFMALMICQEICQIRNKTYGCVISCMMFDTRCILFWWKVFRKAKRDRTNVIELRSYAQEMMLLCQLPVACSAAGISVTCWKKLRPFPNVLVFVRLVCPITRTAERSVRYRRWAAEGERFYANKHVYEGSSDHRDQLAALTALSLKHRYRVFRARRVRNSL